MKKIVLVLLVLVGSVFADNVFFHEFEKVAYKNGNNCWVVDYKNKKSNLVKCSILEERTKEDRHPMQPGMPSFVFRRLFK